MRGPRTLGRGAESGILPKIRESMGWCYDFVDVMGVDWGLLHEMGLFWVGLVSVCQCDDGV